MDRDKRWERVKIAVDGLTGNIAEGTSETLQASSAEEAVAKVEEKYKEDVTDEFLKPILVGGKEGRIQGELQGRTRQITVTDTFCDRWRHAVLLQLSLGPDARACYGVRPPG